MPNVCTKSAHSVGQCWWIPTPPTPTHPHFISSHHLCCLHPIPCATAAHQQFGRADGCWHDVGGGWASLPRGSCQAGQLLANRGTCNSTHTRSWCAGYVYVRRTPDVKCSSRCLMRWKASKLYIVLRCRFTYIFCFLMYTEVLVILNLQTQCNICGLYIKHFCLLFLAPFIILLRSVSIVPCCVCAYLHCMLSSHLHSCLQYILPFSETTLLFILPCLFRCMIVKFFKLSRFVGRVLNFHDTALHFLLSEYLLSQLCICRLLYVLSLKVDTPPPPHCHCLLLILEYIPVWYVLNFVALSYSSYVCSTAAQQCLLFELYWHYSKSINTCFRKKYLIIMCCVF